MEILVLHGSARKHGNTGVLSDAFLRGAADGGHRGEKIELKDLDIRDCLGCGLCRENGGTCVQKDDMQKIYAKMLRADVVVLASPVYFYTWPSMMKRLIDRTFAIEKQLTHKKFYLISAGAAPDGAHMQTMLDSFHQYVDCFPDSTEGGIVFGYGTNVPGGVTNTPAMAQAHEMGKNI